jgi:hypothetical protein
MKSGCGCQFLQLLSVSRHNPPNFHHCVGLRPVTQPDYEISQRISTPDLGTQARCELICYRHVLTRTVESQTMATSLSSTRPDNSYSDKHTSSDMATITSHIKLSSEASFPLDAVDILRLSHDAPLI